MVTSPWILMQCNLTFTFEYCNFSHCNCSISYNFFLTCECDGCVLYETFGAFILFLWPNTLSDLFGGITVNDRNGICLHEYWWKSATLNFLLHCLNELGLIAPPFLPVVNFLGLIKIKVLISTPMSFLCAVLLLFFLNWNAVLLLGPCGFWSFYNYNFPSFIKDWFCSLLFS